MRLALHLLWGAATVAAVYPWAGQRLRRALKRRWSRQLLDALGVKLKIIAAGKVGAGDTAHKVSPPGKEGLGEVGAKVGAGDTASVPRIPSGMVVANHVSWLDIFAINAVAPMAFVSKDDVRHWPLIGWLCARTETIFLERGSRAAAQRTRETMLAELKGGAHVAVFPEGTTTAGDRVLPFHAALFQGAVDAQVSVVPLALRYTDAVGNPSRAPAYDGDVSLGQSLLAIVRAGGLCAELRILTPLDSAEADRRHLASRCHHVIAWHLGHVPMAAPATANPSAAPSDRKESETLGGPQVAPQ